MPDIVGEDNRKHLVQVHCQHFLAGLLERGAIDLLASLIQLFELARNHVSFVLVFGEKQPDTTNRVPQPACGVESWCENEPDPSGGKLFPVQTRRSEQRTHSDIARLREQLEPVTNEHSVLAAEWR